MSLFANSSGFQIHGGTFYDTAGDINVISESGSTVNVLLSEPASLGDRNTETARRLLHDRDRRPSSPSSSEPESPISPSATLDATSQLIQNQPLDPPTQPEILDTSQQACLRHLASRVLNYFTHYAALQFATSDTEFAQILENLKMEWFYIGGLLLGIVALETSTFAIAPSPESLFKVDAFAQRAIAVSSIATGLGILCDAWFILRYYCLQSTVFKTRAKDIYGSYLFFSLSARLPMLGALVSLAALVVFVARVAYNALPVFVAILGIIFCVVMCLQFIIRGTEMFYSSTVILLSVVAGWITLITLGRDRRGMPMETGTDVELGVPPDSAEARS
ncbi:hypothetical protein DFH09DRAFT_69322 [Mycena vulgaris]|nr:hypothetical protein DFH09DRAFT_69322 [Mycena vulgaris]